jgi:hypothetical protein
MTDLQGVHKQDSVPLALGAATGVHLILAEP